MLWHNSKMDSETVTIVIHFFNILQNLWLLALQLIVHSNYKHGHKT